MSPSPVEFAQRAAASVRARSLRARRRLAQTGIPLAAAWARRKLERETYSIEMVDGRFDECCDDVIAWIQKNNGGRLGGDYLEFGVCTGASTIAMAQALDRAGEADTHIYGFDSFAGLPQEADDDDLGVWKPGEFIADRDRTMARIAAAGVSMDRITLVEGWYNETLTPATRDELGVGRAAVVMVDCDMYASAITALEFSVPLLSGPTVMIFDDWHSYDLAAAGLGEAKAWKEILAANPAIEEVTTLGAYNDRSHVVGITVA